MYINDYLDFLKKKGKSTLCYILGKDIDLSIYVNRVFYNSSRFVFTTVEPNTFIRSRSEYVMIKFVKTNICYILRKE